jgi:hypothetical protein
VHYFAQCQLGFLGDDPRERREKMLQLSALPDNGIWDWKAGRASCVYSLRVLHNTQTFPDNIFITFVGLLRQRASRCWQQEFSCRVVPSKKNRRERKSSPFCSLNWEWHWLDDLRGVNHQGRALKISLELFYFFFFFFQDFFFSFPNWWRGLSGRLWEAHT